MVNILYLLNMGFKMVEKFWWEKCLHRNKSLILRRIEWTEATDLGAIYRQNKLIKQVTLKKKGTES